MSSRSSSLSAGPSDRRADAVIIERARSSGPMTRKGSMQVCTSLRDLSAAR